MSYKRMWSCLALTMFVSVPVLAQDAVETDVPTLQLRGVTFNGTGCRVAPGESFPEVVVEGSTLKFFAPTFVTQIGPGVNIAENRKNCLMTLDVAAPAGWSYALDSFEVHGYMRIDAGIKAEVTQTHFFEGAAQNGKWSGSWTGPKHTDIFLKDNIGVASQVWSPCGLERKLVMNTALRLSKVDSKTSPNAAGLLMLDQGIYEQKFGFVWRKC